jgi:hypothetical protein
MPLGDALEACRCRASERKITLEVVTPPYPCAGTGAIRVVRATEQPSAIALVAAYEGFDRL